MHPGQKEHVIVEVTRRVFEDVLARAARSKEAYIDNLIHEVFYHEDRRIATDPHAVSRDRDRICIEALKERMKSASEQEKKHILEEVLERHAQEVIGHFSRPVYEVTTLIAPHVLGVLLNGLSPLKMVRSFPGLPSVSNDIEVGGEVAQLRELKKQGTLIFVPTHSSNMDSIAIGYAIYKMGLPPVTYGAGLNLFHNKFLGFFMHRLGAYKVDRRKKHRLYKNVLKEYATVTIEMGLDNLFFPGGTRCRSGAVEQKLKLGLLGCGLNAYASNLRRGDRKPKVFIVPCTINYQLVLEAETLIEDHLKEAGKSRYIIEDDEFSRLDRIYAFMKNIVAMDAGMFVRIGRALDPFGNPVDESGRSLDGMGRPIDTSRYLLRDGQIVADRTRDAEYTRQLGRKVVKAFMRNTIISSSHLLAWTVFEILRRKNPDPDFYRFLRHSAYDASIPMVEIYREVENTRTAVKVLAERGSLRLSDGLARKSVEDLVDRGLALLGAYHTKPVLERRGDRLFPADMELVYYYRNRLWGFGVERIKA